jgi:hypothetical protein
MTFITLKSLARPEKLGKLLNVICSLTDQFFFSLLDIFLSITVFNGQTID